MTPWRTHAARAGALVASLLAACAADSASRASRDPSGAAPGDADASAAPSADSPPAAECAPNVGASCASDHDCAPCADVPTRSGIGRARVATAVACVDAVCKKTGCPTDACPRGQVCAGCVANLPCRCTAPPGP